MRLRHHPLVPERGGSGYILGRARGDDLVQGGDAVTGTQVARVPRVIVELLAPQAAVLVADEAVSLHVNGG